ncbi:hypothetical protein EOPP23_15170 [Endozoicomonas sp. OPT23]|uniref:hypothetical protein n=1 Tax=Endozoicomonas sp. OPT23 TaxID=2072845 RepID=UPI001890EAE1|nr:hypothetical protein [Endozoicomonas sp. OPT23]MRI34329.1 hypothetical protein [Endozoicomonas sp. OPT23]
MSTIQESSLAIVVASCDKYSDLWQPMFEEFFKHWPDCPFPLYLVANHQTYNDDRVTTLCAGDDLDWSTTVARALQGLNHSHILFWIDDAFLSEDVDTGRVQELCNFAFDQKTNFLRLRPNPKPGKWLNRDIGILNSNAAYRVSLFATIWKIDALNSILKHGESAWQFEVNGTERSRKMDGFYTTGNDVFKYLHGVERGVWILPAARILQKKGYAIDFEYRRIMTEWENMLLKYRLFKSWVLHQIPEKYREETLRRVQRFYRWIGLRRA